MGGEYNFSKIIIAGNKRISFHGCQLIKKCAMEIKPKVLVEIGSADGVSSLLLGMIARENIGHLYCIEPKPTAKWWENIKEFRLLPWITLIPHESPWVTFSIYTIQPIDFLFIDANHKFRWVLVDYHYWFPQIRVGGLIAFHDYNNKFEVKKAINHILEDDEDKLKQIGLNDEGEGSIIIFEKIRENDELVEIGHTSKK